MKVTEQVEFREECQTFLKVMYSKLIEKCPLSNAVVKGASSLSPLVMTNGSKREERIQCLLTKFVQNSLIEGSVADKIKREYLELCEDRAVTDYLKNFKMIEARLDEFLLKIDNFHPLSKDLQDFFKMVFVLFSSNAEVERGFSVNKECLVENLLNDSLIAQRLVYDHVKNECQLDVKNLKITNSLRQYFKNASSKRNESIKLKVREDADKVNEKRKVQQELVLLKAKKQKVIDTKEEEISMLSSNIAYLENKLKK